MATPNYAYAKKQRELAKKQKNEEKQRRKSSKNDTDAPVTESPNKAEPQR